jgi:hypothetical protein
MCYQLPTEEGNLMKFCSSNIFPLCNLMLEMMKEVLAGIVDFQFLAGYIRTVLVVVLLPVWIV